MQTLVDKQYCSQTARLLTDDMLMDTYKKSPSTAKNIKILTTILKNNEITEKVINDIIKDYIKELVAPGTKGSIKGNKFNDIVKKYILKLKLDKDKYEIKQRNNINMRNLR